MKEKAKAEKVKKMTVQATVKSKQSPSKADEKSPRKVFGKKKNVQYNDTFDFLAARKSKLIIRNVSFQCSEEDLKKAFSSFGTITEVKIPTKPDGKKRGFAFVQFTHVGEAEKAINAMNMKEIKGRKVAIDWSMPQGKYMEIRAKNQQDDKQPSQDSVSPTKKLSSEEKPDEDSSSSDEGSDESEGSDMSDDESGSEISEDSDNDSDSGIDEKDKKVNTSAKKDSMPKSKRDPESSHDVHENRTVFVQNLSFDATEKDLSQAMSDYGKLCYAKIVINKDTGVSKGCGFVQFKTAEDATNCIDKLNGEHKGKLLMGKELRVFPAVSRGDADRLNAKKKVTEEKADKRNLHLGREGLIRPGTQAAEGLSQIELNKRERIENAKRNKLKNPNVFFSDTRLCVHNLPKSVDDKKLKDLLLGQFKNRYGVRITECRVMRDMKNLNEKGQGRPLGYAFVDFSRHEHALKALRSFNNNPDIFGPIKRPIVEFSLENRKALEIKEQRKKKFMEKQRLSQEVKSAAQSNSHTGDKMSRKRPLVGKPSTRPSKRINNSATPKNEDTKYQTESRMPFQGSTGTTKSGKFLPLPKHVRPKIRSKNKGAILEQMRKSKKLNNMAVQKRTMQKKQKFEQSKNKEKTSAKRKRAPDGDADFDNLVSKYTKVFSNKLNQVKKPGPKWHE